MKSLAYSFLLAGLLVGGHAWAAELVSASFSSGETQESLTGMSPDDSALKPDGSNVSGENWILAGGGGFDVWQRDNAARMHNGGSVAASLAGNAAKSLVTITAEFTFEHPATEGNSDDASGYDLAALKAGYALLGFYSTVPKQQFGDAYKGFTGFQLNYDGSLQLVVAGEKSGAPIPFGGQFDPTQPYLFTYTVDTATGAVTRVSLGDSTARYDISTTAFAGDAVSFAGFGGSAGNQPLFVEVRNFSVSADPL
ncbi:MAG: hypothetical protein J0I10_21770 [Verrucomicrobia bacterium]|mgnify:CR=1 FL=1|nr:hypothetical protein [Verrucomicrobiota bacterium]